MLLRKLSITIDTKHLDLYILADQEKINIKCSIKCVKAAAIAIYLINDLHDSSLN